MNICLREFFEAATIGKIALFAHESGALLKIIIGFKLMDMPAQVTDSLLYLSLSSKSVAQFTAILFQQLIPSLFSSSVFAAHEYDGSDFTEGKIEFLQL